MASFLLVASVGADDAITFKVRVAVVTGDSLSEVLGSGEFSVPADQYGRVVIALYQNEHDFFVKALGSIQQPITFLLDETKKGSTSEIDLLLDLYLKPTITAGQDIEFEGTLNQMSPAAEEQPTSFTYREDGLNFSIPNGGEHRLNVTSESSRRKIALLVSAFTPDNLEDRISDQAPPVFETSYSLYNEDDQKYEIENHTCRLGQELDDLSTNNECTIRKQFSLGDGKFIDYAITYRLEKTGEGKDQSLLLNFYANRTTTIKTKKKNWLGESVTEIKTVEKSFSKAVTTELGEQLEITIPADNSIELPFDAWEKIIVTYPAKFVGVDKTPILIGSSIPSYPEEARRRNISANVILQAYIDKEGRVKSARAVECNRPGLGFEDAAVEAALKCTYQPAMLREKPIAVWITYRVHFKLD